MTEHSRLATILLGLLLLPALLPSGSAQGADVIRISTERNSALSRLSERVLTEAYGKLGLTLRVEIFPQQRSLFASNEGLVDGELHRIEGIEKMYPNLVRVPVVINLSDTVAVSRNPCIRIRNWESLRPYRIGFVRGTIIMETNTRGMKVTRITEYDNVFPTLLANHVDVVLLPRLDAMVRMTQPPADRLHILEPPLHVTPLYHYLNKRHQALLPRLQAALTDMESSGRIAALQREALAATGHKPSPPAKCAVR